MNLSQIRVALDDAGVRPAKKLGQNFLHDQNLARWIVEQAQISRDDFVLEIGPGLGALTSEILKRGARLLALEKDARLANFLRERFRAQFLSPGPKSLRQLFALPRATKNESEFSIPQYFARL